MLKKHAEHMESTRMKAKFNILKKYILNGRLHDWIKMKKPVLDQCILPTPAADKSGFEGFPYINKYKHHHLIIHLHLC